MAVSLARRRHAGAIAWLWGVGNIAELNHVSRSGMLIIDNEGIQGGASTSNATFRFNWVRRRRRATRHPCAPIGPAADARW